MSVYTDTNTQYTNLSILNELFLWLRLPAPFTLIATMAPVDFTHFEDETVGCVSAVTQFMRKGQDSNVHLSVLKSWAFAPSPLRCTRRVLSIPSAVCDAAAAIPDLMVFFLLTPEPFLYCPGIF